MRLIDADAIELPYKTTTGMDSMVALHVRRIIKDAPTIEAEPVRHGQWLSDKERFMYCSECEKRASSLILVKDNGHWRQEKPNYCPNCGAKMDERRWKINENGFYKCGGCGHLTSIIGEQCGDYFSFWHYCPNCGQKMEGINDD